MLSFKDKEINVFYTSNLNDAFDHFNRKTSVTHKRDYVFNEIEEINRYK